MTNTRRIIIGTRGSSLALKQTHHVRSALLQQNPKLSIDQAIIKTKGDAVLDVSLSKINDKGLFVKEIETALLDSRIDIAVHSMKDLPTDCPDRLVIAAVPEREDPKDVLISRDNIKLGDLPTGSVVATSSLRRKAQLLAFRNDLQIIDIRGNVETRLKKFLAGSMHGMILAMAGLKRLGLEKYATHVLPFDEMLPAPAQGALGVQVRSNDHEMLELVGTLNDQASFQAVTAERSFLKALEGGCQVPIGAYSNINNNRLVLQGKVLSLDGSRTFSGTIEEDVKNAEAAGLRLAQRLIEQGADVLLEEIRGCNVT